MKNTKPCTSSKPVITVKLAQFMRANVASLQKCEGEMKNKKSRVVLVSSLNSKGVGECQHLSYFLGRKTEDYVECRFCGLLRKPVDVLVQMASLDLVVKRFRILNGDKSRPCIVLVKRKQGEPKQLKLRE